LYSSNIFISPEEGVPVTWRSGSAGKEPYDSGLDFRQYRAEKRLLSRVYILALKMRFIVRAKIPTEAGNKMVKDPNFLKTLEDYISKAKPEASYFFEADGDRVAVFIVDMQSNDQQPLLAEPIWQWMGAKVELHPVMNLNDLKKAIS